MLACIRVGVISVEPSKACHHIYTKERFAIYAMKRITTSWKSRARRICSLYISVHIMLFRSTPTKHLRRQPNIVVTSSFGIKGSFEYFSTHRILETNSLPITTCSWYLKANFQLYSASFHFITKDNDDY